MYSKNEYLIDCLKKEMKPALGVTEVGAIALASSKAYSVIGGDIKHIHLTENVGMYKNAYSCSIPGTNKLGNEMALLLGAISGDSSLGLEALKNVKSEDIKKAEELSKKNLIDITVLDDKNDIYIEVEMETTNGNSRVVIKKYHSNIVFVKANDEVILNNNIDNDKDNLNQLFTFDDITVNDIYKCISEVDIKKIEFLQELIYVNRQLSIKGSEGVGLKINKALCTYKYKGILSDDVMYYAQKLTCDALDARLSGVPFPAMSIAGSGSHGIICSLPISAFAEKISINKEKELRAVALSSLLTIYIKYYSGRLSSLCGCVIAGASGASAGITYLLGGQYSEICDAINNMAANLTGMVCDGGSIGCSLKASAGIYSAVLSAVLAMSKTSIPNQFGIVGNNVDYTIKNIGVISNNGMSNVNSSIIDIMQSNTSNI